ncbi:hypothetical protein ACP70R_015177 [Stipagrostis hirtigluma subsp. patula]
MWGPHGRHAPSRRGHGGCGCGGADEVEMDERPAGDEGRGCGGADEVEMDERPAGDEGRGAGAARSHHARTRSAR